MKTKLNINTIWFILSVLISIQLNANNSKGVDHSESKWTVPNATIQYPGETPKDAWQWFMNIDFGRRSKGCKGFGFCSISLYIRGSEENTSDGNALVGAYKVNDGEISFNFPKANMTLATIQQYFSGNSFLVEEPVELPAEVLAKIGFSNFTIKAGSYPIVKESDSYTIHFKK